MISSIVHIHTQGQSTERACQRQTHELPKESKDRRCWLTACIPLVLYKRLNPNDAMPLPNSTVGTIIHACPYQVAQTEGDIVWGNPPGQFCCTVHREWHMARGRVL